MVDRLYSSFRTALTGFCVRVLNIAQKTQGPSQTTPPKRQFMLFVIISVSFVSNGFAVPLDDKEEESACS